jgi:16S rRNA (guanine527-N7)-methyltransferase
MDGFSDDTAASESAQPHLPHLIEGANQLGLALTAGQLARFARYQELLLEWNRRVNLTAITDPAGVQVRHFLDSLSCSLAMDTLPGQSLIDVGTGAGFPGIALKIYYPDLRLTLVESVAKKTHFLATVVAELGLAEVDIVTERAEVLGHNPEHRERYDWVVARAVAEMRVLAEYLLPLCRPGGYVLAQKGAGAPEETAGAARAIETLGGALPHLHAIQLPGLADPRQLVVIQKERATPPHYPRRTGIPSKRPLA